MSEIAKNQVLLVLLWTMCTHSTNVAAQGVSEEVSSTPSPATQPATSHQPSSNGVINVGTLIVTTSPPGARVIIHGENSGLSPVSKALATHSYRVEVELADYKSEKARVRIDPGETERLHFDLQRIYPSNPYKVWGHVTFWPGLSLVALGVVAIPMAKSEAGYYADHLDESSRISARSWTGVMWAGFGFGGALITTSIVLWAVSPGDKAYYEQQRQETSRLSLVPVGNEGAALSYSGRF